MLRISMIIGQFLRIKITISCQHQNCSFSEGYCLLCKTLSFQLFCKLRASEQTQDVNEIKSSVFYLIEAGDRPQSIIRIQPSVIYTTFDKTTVDMSKDVKWVYSLRGALSQTTRVDYGIGRTGLVLRGGGGMVTLPPLMQVCWHDMNVLLHSAKSAEPRQFLRV